MAEFKAGDRVLTTWGTPGKLIRLRPGSRDTWDWIGDDGSDGYVSERSLAWVEPFDMSRVSVEVKEVPMVMTQWYAVQKNAMFQGWDIILVEGTSATKVGSLSEEDFAEKVVNLLNGN